MATPLLERLATPRPVGHSVAAHAAMSHEGAACCGAWVADPARRKVSSSAAEGSRYLRQKRRCITPRLGASLWRKPFLGLKPGWWCRYPAKPTRARGLIGNPRRDWPSRDQRK